MFCTLVVGIFLIFNSDWKPISLCTVVVPTQDAGNKTRPRSVPGRTRRPPGGLCSRATETRLLGLAGLFWRPFCRVVFLAPLPRNLPKKKKTPQQNNKSQVNKEPSEKTQSEGSQLEIRLQIRSCIVIDQKRRGASFSDGSPFLCSFFSLHPDRHHQNVFPSSSPSSSTTTTPSPSPSLALISVASLFLLWLFEFFSPFCNSPSSALRSPAAFLPPGP